MSRAQAGNWRRYLGRWRLDPTSCRYPEGDAPRAATYTLSSAAPPTGDPDDAPAPGPAITFAIVWEDRDGLPHDLTFTASLAGPVLLGEVTITLFLDSDDERALITEARRDGVLLSRGIRRLVDGDSVLEVTQERDGLGTTFARYRRVDPLP